MTITLLDAADTRRRLAQNLLIFGGGLLLIGSLLAFNMAPSPKNSVAGWLTLLAGFAALVAGFMTKLRWQIDYRGHAIVVENGPIRGERLLVDGAAAAKGKLGIRNTLTAVLPEGDRIIATTVAGLATFRCRITVETDAVPAAISARNHAGAMPFE